MGQRALAVVEGGAVDRVDRGDAEAGGGRPAQDAGLRAVGVDDLRPNLGEEAKKSAVALPIPPGMDAATHLGDDA